MKATAVIVVLLGLLALAGYFVVDAWTSIDSEISTDGKIALALGVVFSFLIGAGLMALLFYSHRKGHDDIDR